MRASSSTLQGRFRSRKAWMVVVGVRDRLGVDRAMQDRRQARVERPRQGRGEVLVALDPLAVAAEGRGVGGEIGVLERGAGDAAGIFALLVHPDRAVHAVIDQDDDHRQPVLHGGGEFLAVHQEVAVARHHHDGPLRQEPLGADGRRHAVAHRARGRGELAVMGRNGQNGGPGGEVARAVAQDRVGRQHLAQVGHHAAHLEGARGGDPGRIAPGEVIGVQGLGAGGPGQGAGRLHRLDPPRAKAVGLALIASAGL